MRRFSIFDPDTVGTGCRFSIARKWGLGAGFWVLVLFPVTCSLSPLFAQMGVTGQGAVVGAGIANNPGFAPTPPMGWLAWPVFSNGLTDAETRAIADAMVSNGFVSAGYTYLVLDSDGWNLTTRDATGNLQPNATKFPSGMAALITYIHGDSLKAGMYFGSGTTTCGGYAGSKGYEGKDAALIASWGADLLKWDITCGMTGQNDQMASIQRIATALNASGRNIVLTTGDATQTSATYFYARGAQSARIGPDISSNAGNLSWTGVSLGFTNDSGISSIGGPGHWLDFDALPVGEGTVTDTEGQTAMALWSIQAAPLWFGADIRPASSPDAATLATLTNTDIISVDQDALGFVGVQVSSVACGSATCQVWAKQLTGTNTCAIALFNLDSSAHNITATFSTVAATVPACGSGPYTTTRDLWAHSSLGTLTTSYTASSVPAHGNAIIKVAP
jgi:alpha-galactosidase